MQELDIYTDMMYEGFKDDPGLLAQMGGMANFELLFKAQCRGELEAFSKLGLLQVCGDNDGLLLGFTSDQLQNEEFVQALQASAQYLLTAASVEELTAIQNRAVPVAAISQPDWYKKFVGEQRVYIIQVLVVKEAMRGKGVCRKLLTPVLEKCAQQNIPVTLQTHNPANLQKYEHFDFKLLEQVQSQEINLTCYNFLKEPTKM